MEQDKNQIDDISIVVSNDFKISESGSLIPATDFETLEEFKIYLTEKLTFLLEDKYDTLINILYRIDVNEEKLKELFASRGREFMPGALADLIIERSLQKIEFRRRYKNGEI